MRGVMDYCFDAGVKGIVCYGIGVTLRSGDREYFYQQLDRHFPGLRKQYERKYGYSYECLSDRHSALMRLFHSECEAHGVMWNSEEIFSYLNEFPIQEPVQLSLF